jgi:hypothetical protein
MGLLALSPTFLTDGSDVCGSDRGAINDFNICRSLTKKAFKFVVPAIYYTHNYIYDRPSWAANQALVTFAVNCVGTNLVTFMAVVMRLDNADAANRANNWAGTTYVFSIAGALISDSYWGRYKACTIFQIIFLAVSSN